MDAVTIIILAITAFTGGLILSYIQRKNNEAKVKAALRSRVRVADIMQMREELKRLQNESNSAKVDYQKAKDEYAKRYHSKPNSGGNDSGSSSN